MSRIYLSGLSPAFASLLLAGAVACSAQVEPAETADGGGGGTGGAAETGGTGGSGGGATGGDTNTGGTDAGAGHPAPVQEIASRQSVRIELTNNSNASLWLLEDGELCAGMKVESYRAGAWVELPVRANSPNLNDACCMGGCDWGGGMQYFAEVPAGQSKVFQWDARAEHLSNDTYTCYYDEFYETGLQPVGPGQYRLTLGLRTDVGQLCKDKGEGVVWCGFGGATSLPPPVEAMCEVPETLVVELELPASGDVELAAAYP